MGNAPNASCCIWSIVWISLLSYNIEKCLNPCTVLGRLSQSQCLRSHLVIEYGPTAEWLTVVPRYSSLAFAWTVHTNRRYQTVEQYPEPQRFTAPAMAQKARSRLSSPFQVLVWRAPCSKASDAIPGRTISALLVSPGARLLERQAECRLEKQLCSTFCKFGRDWQTRGRRCTRVAYHTPWAPGLVCRYFGLGVQSWRPQWKHAPVEPQHSPLWCASSRAERRKVGGCRVIDTCFARGAEKRSCGADCLNL
ncbi:hypothetical protein K491DRAFT_493826 [Lophiostoma macrostomum CBS 122681]|uniref:Secreted protein n=1 Tax=Lophiostoma macrostomum CBS 122681 TaxID=1314788 RepID=A0A6A6T647_9PLEO|nr:hypothetical protein K491DRAFT_493826 [Lophiostoma macrostomum CBS 122681]